MKAKNFNTVMILIAELTDLKSKSCNISMQLGLVSCQSRQQNPVARCENLWRMKDHGLDQKLLTQRTRSWNFRGSEEKNCNYGTLTDIIRIFPYL